MITTENCELYFLQYLENSLDPKGRREVEAFATQHPELAEELALYAQSPEIEKDESIVFAGKEGLKHVGPMPLHRGIIAWRWSAAAAVLLAVGATFALRKRNVEPVVPQVAVTKPAVKVLPMQEKIVAEKTLVVKPQAVHSAPDMAEVIEPEVVAEHLEPIEEEALLTFTPEPLLAEVVDEEDLEAALYREIELLLSKPEESVAEVKTSSDDGFFATVADRYRPSTEQMVNVVVKGYEAKLAYDRIMEKTESFREALSVNLVNN